MTPWGVLAILLLLDLAGALLLYWLLPRIAVENNDPNEWRGR